MSPWPQSHYWLKVSPPPAVSTSSPGLPWVLNSGTWPDLVLFLTLAYLPSFPFLKSMAVCAASSLSPWLKPQETSQPPPQLLSDLNTPLVPDVIGRVINPGTAQISPSKGNIGKSQEFAAFLACFRLTQSGLPFHQHQLILSECTAVPWL